MQIWKLWEKRRNSSCLVLASVARDKLRRALSCDSTECPLPLKSSRCRKGSRCCEREGEGESQGLLGFSQGARWVRVTRS